MPQRQFNPGFRLSVFDAAILVCGSISAFIVGKHIWWAGFIIGFVVGHFFLFCNVFKIPRRFEYLWGATFILLTGCNLFTGIPGWIGTIAGSLALTLFLIVREMRMPHYHGIFWQKINPGLRKWWENQEPRSPVP